MLNFNINLTSFAFILWSGMLIIAGSVLVLSSQVRKVADLIEDHERTAPAASRVESAYDARLAAAPARVARRGASLSLRSNGRPGLSGPSRGTGPAPAARPQLAPPRRGAASLSRRLTGTQAASECSSS